MIKMSSEAVILFPLFFFGGLALFAMIMHSLTSRKSREYRRELADMYVVGKIKKIAKDEDIDLLEELKEFARVTKNKKLDFESIDNTIEREMQEKIANKDKKKKNDKPE